MTQVDKTTFRSETASRYADNETGNISAGDLRANMFNIADSAPFIVTGKASGPIADDDGANTNGTGFYEIGDLWIDESNNQAYICLDNATGNAIWTVVTFSNDQSIVSTGGPAPDELVVFVDSTTVASTNGRLTWNGATLTIDGEIDVNGNVAGRDLVADGAKLDAIPSDAINQIVIGEETVDGATSGFPATTLTFETGDGLSVFNPTAGEFRLQLANNRIYTNTSDRTLDANDNGAYITNDGATSAVTWIVPQTGNLANSGPKLVTTFFKSTDQPMQLVGITGVTINGNTESGANESLTSICANPFSSVAWLIYSGTANTYFLYESSSIEKSGTTFVNEVAFFTGDGVIDGDSTLLWDGSVFTISGKLNYLKQFNEQVGITYTLALTDQNDMVPMDNAAANTVTIPAEASIDFPIGSVITVMQKGAGATTISADVGVTLNGILGGSGAVSAQWKETKLYKAAADTWYATGDIGVVS